MDSAFLEFDLTVEIDRLHRDRMMPPDRINASPRERIKYTGRTGDLGSRACRSQRPGDRAQPLLGHTVRACELDQSGHKLRMCMDVEDVARDVASRCASHERLTPEAELRFGLAVRVAVA